MKIKLLFVAFISIIGCLGGDRKSVGIKGRVGNVGTHSLNFLKGRNSILQIAGGRSHSFNARIVLRNFNSSRSLSASGEFKSVPEGISDFKEAVEGGYRYVDKTGLIAELLSRRAKVTNILRPRGFGKTMAQSSLRHFFDLEDKRKNRELFRGLEIEKSKYFDEQGCYPVIDLTFKNARGRYWTECLENISYSLVQEYRRHSFLIDSNGGCSMGTWDKHCFEEVSNGYASERKLKESLLRLSEHLGKHYCQKVVILIDEYDIPMVEGEQNGYGEEVKRFMGNFLSYGLEENSHLHMGVLMGTTKGASEVNGGCGNVSQYSVTDGEYVDRFGFTIHEVNQLLGEYDLEKGFVRVNAHYGGYTIGDMELYRSSSIMRYIAKGESNNIIDTDDATFAKEKIKLLLSKYSDRGVVDSIGNIYNLKEALIEPHYNVDMGQLSGVEEIFTMLLNRGYLRFEREEKGSGWKESSKKLKVRIPNLEVEEVYREAQREILDSKYLNGGFEKLFATIANEGDEEVEEAMERELMNSSSRVFCGGKMLRDCYHFFHALIRVAKEDNEVKLIQGVDERKSTILVIPKRSKQGIILSFSKEDSNSYLQSLEKEGRKAVARTLGKESIAKMENGEYKELMFSKGVEKLRVMGIGIADREIGIAIEDISLQNPSNQTRDAD